MGDCIGPMALEYSERKLKVSNALFKWPKCWRPSKPPPTLIFLPKSPDQNFEIAIVFSIVKKSNNYVFRHDSIPHSPGGRVASCELWSLFTYSIGYWEVYGHFQWDFFWWGESGEKVTWKDLSMEEFYLGEGNFPWRGHRISQHYLKKDQKLKKKQGFSTESKGQHKNLKLTEIITYTRGFSPASILRSLH